MTGWWPNWMNGVKLVNSMCRTRHTRFNCFKFSSQSIIWEQFHHASSSDCQTMEQLHSHQLTTISPKWHGEWKIVVGIMGWFVVDFGLVMVEYWCEPICWLKNWVKIRQSVEQTLKRTATVWWFARPVEHHNYIIFSCMGWRGVVNQWGRLVGWRGWKLQLIVW